MSVYKTPRETLGPPPSTSTRERESSRCGVGARCRGKGIGKGLITASRGARLMAPALDLMLTTSSAEQTDRFFLSAQSTTIGRLAENDIQIYHPYISREHAIIKWRHSHVYVFDTSSSGTWLNGVRLENGGPGTALRYDDVRARACPARCCISMTAWPPTHISRACCGRSLSLDGHPTLRA